MAQGKANEVVFKTERMLMSEIEPDWNWNVRRHTGEVVEDPEKELGPENDTGFTGLVKSIEVEGQKEEVEVRPTPKGHPSKKPYLLTTGFRRFKALQYIAQKNGNKSPTILAVVKPMTEEQARIRNIEENTGRKDLMGADYVFGVGEMKKANPTITQTRIAELFGLKQGYVSRLLKVSENVDPKILSTWRDDVATRVALDDMFKLADKPQPEQPDLYEALRAAKKEQTGRKDYPAKVKAYLESCEREAKRIGTLVRSGAIELLDEDAFFDIGHDDAKVYGLVAFTGKPPQDGEKSNGNELRRYQTAAKKAFSEVIDAPEEKEDAPVDAKKGAAKAGKKPANGAKSTHA